MAVSNSTLEYYQCRSLVQIKIHRLIFPERARKIFLFEKKIITRFKQGEVFPVLGISHLWIYTCTLLVLCVCVEVLLPSQQLRSCRASQLPINTVPGQFTKSIASAFRELLSIYVFSYFPFGFEGRMWDLIVSVPDHCLSFYLIPTKGFTVLSEHASSSNW